MRWLGIINIKNYKISNKVITKTPHIIPIKYYSFTIMVNFFLLAYLVNLTVSNKQLFSVNLLVGLHGQLFNIKLHKQAES